MADAHGVLTYYPDLRTEPPAPVTIAVCAAEACQATGARDLVAHLGRSVAPPGGRSADGVVAVREVFCLGNCALGPAVAVNGRLVGPRDAGGHRRAAGRRPRAGGGMTATVFVPRDSAARSVGADEVAVAVVPARRRRAGSAVDGGAHRVEGAALA